MTRGEWRYQVVLDEGVAMMKKPLLGSPRKSSKGSIHAPALPGSNKAAATLEFREVVVINERIRPFNSKGSFLRLADGRGYVLDFSQGRHNLQRMDLGPGMDMLDDARSPAAPFVDIPVSNSAEQDAARVRSLTAPLMENLYTKMWSRSSSTVMSTPEAVMASALADLGVPDFGQWHYIVLDDKGITARSAPTYDASQKLRIKIKEGELVRVVERRSGGGTTFLRLEDNLGWVFDMQPSGGNNMRQRMMEVTVEEGKWLYRVGEDQPQGPVLRSRCSFLAPSAVAHGCYFLQPGSLVTATRRTLVGNTTFLFIECEEKGWIYDSKDGRRLIDGPITLQKLGITATVSIVGGARLHTTPSNCKWAMTDVFLERGTSVQVEQSGEVGGKGWAKVNTADYPEGWIASDSIEFESSRSWGR